MQLFPQKLVDYRRLVTVLFVVAFTLIFTLIFLANRYKHLREANENKLHINTFNDDSHQFTGLTCLNNVSDKVFNIYDNQVVSVPKCLTVMNSRLGSRLNFDWYFGEQQVRSSTLGIAKDKNINFKLQLLDNNSGQQIFPLNINDSQPQISNKLGLTFQEVKYDFIDFDLILTIRTPFSPSKQITDANAKLSLSPFMYIDLEVVNKTNKPLSQKIALSLSGFTKKDKNRNLLKLYFSDPSQPNANLSLATPRQNNNQITWHVNHKQAGFNWDLAKSKSNNEKYLQRFIYAGYNNDTVLADVSHKSGRKLMFAYNKWFDTIDDVLSYAFAVQKTAINKSQKFEKILQNLSPQEKWIAAQAFHSYLGNTYAVYNPEDKQHSYYVWEGEFQYLNTLDVAHDYAVLEGKYFPWALKYSLISWQQAIKKSDYGLVIPHDLGKGNIISGTQAYQIEGWETSGMPVEENLNFILLSLWYLHQTNDASYNKLIHPYISALLQSIIMRDTNNNGIVDDHLGMTTYDIDSSASIKNAPDNTYLGIKQLAAYILAKDFYVKNKQPDMVKILDDQSQKILSSLQQVYQNNKFIALSLDKNFTKPQLYGEQKIYGSKEQGFAYISGLFYPAIMQPDSIYLRELSDLLKKDYPQAYQKSLFKFASSQGLQLTEFEDNHLGWLSHSMMADFIAKNLWQQDYQSYKLFFQRLVDSPFAYTDGFYWNDNYPFKQALLYYPRGVAIFAKAE